MSRGVGSDSTATEQDSTATTTASGHAGEQGDRDRDGDREEFFIFSRSPPRVSPPPTVPRWSHPADDAETARQHRGSHAGRPRDSTADFHETDATTTTVHSQYTYYYYGRLTQNVYSTKRPVWRWAA